MVLACAGRPATLEGSFAGEDEFRVLELTLEPGADEVTFSAAARPVGATVDAEGRVVLRTADRVEFDWTDSFGNVGRGALRHRAGSFALELEPTRVEDAQPLRLYGEWELTRAPP